MASATLGNVFPVASFTSATSWASSGEGAVEIGGSGAKVRLVGIKF